MHGAVVVDGDVGGRHGPRGGSPDRPARGDHGRALPGAGAHGRTRPSAAGRRPGRGPSPAPVVKPSVSAASTSAMPGPSSLTVSRSPAVAGLGVRCSRADGAPAAVDVGVTGQLAGGRDHPRLVHDAESGTRGWPRAPRGGRSAGPPRVRTAVAPSGGRRACCSVRGRFGSRGGGEVCDFSAGSAHVGPLPGGCWALTPPSARGHALLRR